ASVYDDDGQDKEVEVARIIRLPVEFHWLMEVKEFGIALDGLIEMARNGLLQDLSKKKNEIFSQPRVEVAISGPERHASARISIRDQWIATRKLDTVAEIHLNPDGEIPEEIMLQRYPLLEMVFWRPMEIKKAELLDERTKERLNFARRFSEEPAMLFERRINQGLIEALGEELRG
ncbi:MAG TPA: hypothetical protein VGN75_15095, partial [Kaistia sp.]|nr:hypothetical protein [Kaistia sp.]